MRTINIETGKMKSIIHSKWHAHNHNNRITMILFGDGSITAYPMSPTTSMHITKEHNELEPDSMGSVWLGDIYDFNISDEDLKKWIVDKISKCIPEGSWELFFDGIPYKLTHNVLNCTKGEKQVATKLSEKARKNKSAYDAKRTAEVSTLIAIRLQNADDQDVIDYINSQPNKAEFLRQIVRAEMKKNQD